MARSKKERAREACDLLLLSLYCNIPPGRGLEVRTLEVIHEAKLTEPFVPANFRNRNVALVHKEGGLTIHVQKFKTYHCAGKDTVPIEVCCQALIPNGLVIVCYFCRIMCILCTPRLIYRSSYRPTVDRYIGRHIGRVSVDMTTYMRRSTYGPIYRPIYRPRCRPSVG